MFSKVITPINIKKLPTIIDPTPKATKAPNTIAINDLNITFLWLITFLPSTLIKVAMKTGLITNATKSDDPNVMIKVTGK